MHSSDSASAKSAPNTEQLEVTYRGRRAIVEKSQDHPEHYLWLLLDGRRFFLGVRTPGMTRGDVKGMAAAWLDMRPGE